MGGGFWLLSDEVGGGFRLLSDEVGGDLELKGFDGWEKEEQEEKSDSRSNLYQFGSNFGSMPTSTTELTLTFLCSGSTTS